MSLKLSPQSAVKTLPFEKPVSILVFFLLATFPLLFGAVHPIVQGGYTALILLSLGGWLLYASPELSWHNCSWFHLAVPIILICYVALQALPLPPEVLAILSPVRAARVEMVNSLANAGRIAASVSENGIVGVQNAIFFLSLLLFFLALSVLLRKIPGFLIGVVYVVVGIGFLEGIYGLLQVLNPGVGILWLPIQSRAAYGTIIYKNQYAAFLNMCWPLAVAGGLVFLQSSRESKKRFRNQNVMQRFSQFLAALKIQIPVFFFAAGLMILAVIFSLSRGGILAMLLVSFLLNFALPFSRKAKLLVTLLLIAFLGGYGSLLGLDGVINRFSKIDISGLARLDIYQASLPLVYDHPLTGIGVDSYKLLSGVYLKEFPENTLYDHVHNDYLEAVIELGLPMAGLLFVWIFFGVAISGKKLLERRAIVQEEQGATFIIGTAAFCALLGFLIHGGVDFGWRLPTNAVYAVTLAALITNASRRRHHHGEPIQSADNQQRLEE